MAMIAIDINYVYAMILITFFSLFGGIALYMVLKKNAPDAFVHWAAKKQGKPVCRVHYRGKAVRDYIAAVEKAEKAVGTPYWTIPDVGIKFKPEPDDIQFIENNTLSCANYFENTLESQNIRRAVAFSQLKDYFKKKGVSIEGLEREALYVASEAQSNPVETAILNAKIDNEETRNYLIKYLKAIKDNKTELESTKLTSGVFTFQTAMKAIDSTIAYTSSHAAHMKEVIRAVIMHQEADKRKDLIMYAIVGFILCIGAASFIIVLR